MNEFSKFISDEIREATDYERHMENRFYYQSGTGMKLTEDVREWLKRFAEEDTNE